MTLHACLACGHRGPEVQMTIVEIPPEEQRVVDQGTPVSWDVRGRVIGMAYSKVRERWVNEPRCPDYNPEPGKPSKCRERIAAAEPVHAPTAPPAEADPLPAFLRPGGS